MSQTNIDDLTRKLVDDGVRLICDDALLTLYIEDGLDAFCAFFAKEYGLDALRAELAAWRKHSFQIDCREPLDDAARQLGAKHLGHVGAVLREIAEELPSAIDKNPYLDTDPRQARQWDFKFLIERQRETGLHLRELVNFYKEYVPGVADFGILVNGKHTKFVDLSDKHGTLFSQRRERNDEQIERMRAERGLEKLPVLLRNSPLVFRKSTVP
jgi:hypothetical protein